MYKAIVCKVKTRNHPNADRLKLGLVQGYQVIVDINTQDDEIGVFFPADGQLSKEFSEANNLIGYTDKETGERKGGFFGKNRRVRAINLRSEKSEGYWCSLKCFEFTGYDISKFKEGVQFDTLNNIPICNKYFTSATLKAGSNNKSQIKRTNDFFHKHPDTVQLRYGIKNIKKGSILYLSEKLHGTSGRYGYLKDKKMINRKFPFNYIGKYFGIGNQREIIEYDYLIGTRNVILKDHKKKTYYDNEDFRKNVVEKIREHLFKGECLYFEIVGYTTNNTSIMANQDIKKLSDKNISKKYGDEMKYKYGCLEGTCEMYVYNITMTDHKGFTISLPYQQMVKRCETLDIKYAPQYCFDNGQFVNVFGGDFEKLQKHIDDLTEGESLIDDTHIQEGIVLRIEDENGVNFLKSKSHTFGILEGYLKDSENYVDLEEIS